APADGGATRNAWAHAQVATNPVALLITITASAASALGVAVAGHTVAFQHPLELVTFVAVAIALQFVAVEIYDRGAISFGGTGLLALGFAVGPAGAMAAAVVTAAIRLGVSRGRLYRAVFDAAQFALAAGAATPLYRLVPVSGTMPRLGID